MWSIRSRAREAVLLTWLAAVPAQGAEVTLQYVAFVAGAPVGEATVDVSVVDGRYQVEGAAASNGWLKGFTRWRNQFSARGRVEGSERKPALFSYTEEDRDKTRDVTVEDGTLQVIKNGRPREAQPAPPFPDVISGLFVQPHCRGDQVFSTGRHVYRLTRLERNPDGCHYAVMDDDDDTFEIELELARRNGLVVPIRIKVHAWLSGWLELKEPEQG